MKDSSSFLMCDVAREGEKNYDGTHNQRNSISV